MKSTNVPLDGRRTPPRPRRRSLPARSRRWSLAGDRESARDRFGALVALLQRRGLRIAYHYLRDTADADEAVQDAFVKVFLHIEQYREDLSFDVWFMRILVNSCLDRLKSRTRQQRWLTSPADQSHEGRPVEQAAGPEPSTEHHLLVRERWDQSPRGGCRLARSPTARVHHVASGRANGGRNQRGDGNESSYRARAPVPGNSQAAGDSGSPAMSVRTNHVPIDRLTALAFVPARPKRPRMSKRFAMSPDVSSAPLNWPG